MNNLKTMAALAAVMLAGLAAPMATASHANNCVSDFDLLPPLETNSRTLDTDGTTAAPSHERIGLPAWNLESQAIIEDDAAKVDFTILYAEYVYPPATPGGSPVVLCEAVRTIDGDSIAALATDFDIKAGNGVPERFFVVVALESGESSATYTMRRDA